MAPPGSRNPIRLLKSERGINDMVLAVMFIGVASVAILAYLNMISTLDQDFDSALHAKIKNFDNETAIETFLQAFRWAEISYARQLATCNTAKPFVYALREGSGCPTPVTSFSASVETADAQQNSDIYTYAGAGCTIGPTGSDCQNPATPIITIGYTAASQKIDHRAYRFYLVKAWPELHATEFLLVSEGGGQSQNARFLMRDFFANLAHLQPDGTVIQENPVPTSNCYGMPWAAYQTYDSTNRQCVGFVQLGSGSGLAFYNKRFFGFRPFDGTVIDMLNLSTGLPSYIVSSTDGSVGGAPAFVPYPNPADTQKSLVNVDDITTIDQQIYFVAKQGLEAQMGYADTSGVRQTICDLGSRAWAQAYTGIAALNWSDALIPDPGDPMTPYLQNRGAFFFLKTDSGEMLTSVVYSPSPGNYECFVGKDPSLQQIEYKRTLGFDRTEDVKPFYVY